MLNFAMAPKKLFDQDSNVDKPNIVDEPPLSTIPQLNIVIIANIARFADFDTLKTMRQVNIVWSEGSTPKFRKRCYVLLKMGENIENGLNLRRFKENTKKLQPILNIRVELELKFCPPGFGKRKVKIFNEILRFVSPSLKCFKISGNVFPQQTIAFPKLVKLVLLSILSSKSNPPIDFNNSPNLAELNIQNLLFFDSASFAFPSLLNANGSRKHSVLPKLEVLTLKSPYDLKFLSTFTQSWSKLDLYVSTDAIKHLEKFLMNQSLNLVSLTLRIFSEFFPKSRAVELNFPDAFPSLQKLAISFKSFECHHFNMRFGEGALNYSKTLPNIKTLSIYCTQLTRNNLANIWKTFFPKQVCTTLTLFEMDFEKLYSNVLHGVEDEEWYKELFPNAQVENIQTTLSCF